MKNNEVKALLAVSVIAVPLVFATGCGKKTEAPADTASTVAVTETMVAETIEDGLANMGIELETEVSIDETLDESMAGTYYVISEDGISAYSEDSSESEVADTFPYDTELTVLGMSTDTNLFKVSNADGTYVWVSSDGLDTVRGGLQESVSEEPAPEETDTETKGSETASNGDTLEDIKKQDWYQSLTPAERASLDDYFKNGGNSGGGVNPNWDNGQYDRGDGSETTWSNIETGKGDYSDLIPSKLDQ